MSYYAIGRGKAVIEPEFSEEQANNLIKDSVETAENLDPYFQSPDYEIVKDKKDLVITFNTEGNYFKEDVTRFLDLLMPFIASGMVTFTGQDYSVWSYVFDPEELVWNLKRGKVVYGMEDCTDDILIQELQKRGYSVSKSERLSIDRRG